MCLLSVRIFADVKDQLHLKKELADEDTVLEKLMIKESRDALQNVN